MAQSISSRVWEGLACPECGSPLAQRDGGAYCAACQLTYPFLDNGQLDLRLQRPKTRAFQFELGKPLLPSQGFPFTVLIENPHPAVDLDSAKIPWHLTRALLSHFPKAKGSGALMLDLGCGDGVHRRAVEAFGFEWVGLDYTLPEAPIRGDAHALPFLDDSFEFVLSIAVLEHIQYPFVMASEAYRVLQPGGLLIGTVSFQEPFHNDSYYHHSHLATYNSLHSAGFEVLQVSPSPEWPALVAISEMALFRMMPGWMVRILIWPLQILHRIWWALGYAITKAERSSEKYRVLSTSGAFSFIARKPNP
ncbi:MAG: methyltransferase domain-containing protein [Anaerolineales bacterium]